MERLTTYFLKKAVCNATIDVCIQQTSNPLDDNCCCYCEINNKMIAKLADYEDLEEQGLLLRLPCKVGDEFWVIAYKSKVITHVKCSGYVIQEDVPNGIKNKYVWLDSVKNPRDYWKLDFKEFDRQCFKTKAEAEQALKQMGE